MIITSNRLYRLIIPILAFLIDVSLTIYYQPPGYWSGDLSTAREANPFGEYFMTQHVSGLFILCAIWLAIIILLGIFLPKKASRIFLLFTLIAHSWGASSWIDDFWVILLLTFAYALGFILIDDWVVQKENR